MGQLGCLDSHRALAGHEEPRKNILGWGRDCIISIFSNTAVSLPVSRGILGGGGGSTVQPLPQQWGGIGGGSTIVMAILTLQHGAVGIVCNSKDVRRYFISLLPLVHVHYSISVDWQTLVRVNYHTKQP